MGGMCLPLTAARRKPRLTLSDNIYEEGFQVFVWKLLAPAIFKPLENRQLCAKLVMSVKTPLAADQ
jgi:hypothetical protein